MNKEITWLVWRKGARSPKLNALIEILAPQLANTPGVKDTRQLKGKPAARLA